MQCMQKKEFYNCLFVIIHSEEIMPEECPFGRKRYNNCYFFPNNFVVSEIFNNFATYYRLHLFCVDLNNVIQ